MYHMLTTEIYHPQIEFVRDKSTKEPFPPNIGLGTRIQDTALQPEFSISLFANTGTIEGKAGDHVFLSPPYNVSKEEIDTIVDVTGKVLDDVFGRLALDSK